MHEASASGRLGTVHFGTVRLRRSRGRLSDADGSHSRGRRRARPSPLGDARPLQHRPGPRRSGRFHAARMKTAWQAGRSERLRSSTAPICAPAHSATTSPPCSTGARYASVASVRCSPNPRTRGRGHARRLIETLLDDAAPDGADIALLFSRSGDPAFAGFQPIGMSDTAIEIVDTPRPGAPMTLVRGGEARDLPAIVAMGQVRAAPCRFHLDRDVDLVHYAITAKAAARRPRVRRTRVTCSSSSRKRASRPPPTSSSAIAGSRWTIEECGDRDPSGARVARAAAGVGRARAGGTPADDRRMAAVAVRPASGHGDDDTVNRGDDDPLAQRAARTAPERRRPAVLARRHLLIGRAPSRRGERRAMPTSRRPSGRRARPRQSTTSSQVAMSRRAVRPVAG